ncbi:hypothetical protein BKA83DRAFT_1976580 [Pisolithus microcarpus]|nr:hypothetical protein BKA83DRAFT_1976580 [Pisolithus microcarpus]
MNVMSFFGARLTPQNGQPVPNAEPVVLKDSWSAHDQNREDEILVQIFDDLRQKNGLEKETEAGKHFLTVLAAGNVIVDRKIDDAESFLRYPDRLPAGYGLHSLRADESPKPTWTGEGIIPNFSCVSPSATQSKTHHRTHYRLVFKEVCQPIYELRRLDIVFKTLMDIHKALEFLHSVDWVHRDISSGNVLCWGEMGKLAGLEYAKRMDSNTAHEVRTGTLDFMACEVETQRYLFEEHIGVLFVPVDCPFRFNPLHDMESLVDCNVDTLLPC